MWASHKEVVIFHCAATEKSRTCPLKTLFQSFSKTVKDSERSQLFLLVEGV